jgi:tRNA nucleotidyltransferase (CCA-adding enzyme)
MVEARLAQMRATVPGAVAEVCRILRAAGHQAWTVGGAVRDLLLDQEPGDWDVTTEALPDEVMSLFERTFPTGIEHGTITVLMGQGAERQTIEVTTFRGEGDYTDSRRPDSVHFGVTLDEDLERRDFVINAMAFDPVDGTLYDPFGGAEDIRAGRIRAVGRASERFSEDGLRVMRAVRFVSVLDFELDAETEAGIRPALESLAQVAQERVRVELLKLLAGKAAGRALRIAAANGVLDVILPELDWRADAEERWSRIDICEADPVLRLALLLEGMSEELLEANLRRLTMSNEDRRRLVAMLRHHDELLAEPELDDAALRAHLARVGRAAVDDHLAVLDARARQAGHRRLAEVVARARELMAAGVALAVRELDIDGKRVMALSGLKGRVIGDILEALLAEVLVEPSHNRAEYLDARVPELAERLS